MSFKKIARKSIALALVGLTIAMPLLNGVYALEEDNMSEILTLNNISTGDLDRAIKSRSLFDSQTSNSDIFSKDQVTLFKVEFQNLHGVEDIFKVVEETNDYIIEANGFKGILRIKNKSSNEVVILELFETIDRLHNESMSGIVYTPSRPSSWKTNGPDKANMKVVKGSSRDTITISHPISGKTKTYTKDTNNWYSGYTKGYYDHVQKGRSYYSNVKTYAGGTAIAAVTTVVDALISGSNLHLSASEIFSLLKKSGATLVNASLCASNVALYTGQVALILVDYSNI